MKKYLLLANALFLCACVNNANVTKNNQCFSVSYLNENLNKKLKCEERTNNDINNLLVSLALTNLSKSELKLKITYDWFSDNGIHIYKPDLAKKEIIINPLETKYIKLGAPANAHNYKVQIREFK